MDFYRKKLNHFGWTWLEHKTCRWHGERKHFDHRFVTRLARAYAKRNVREEIDDEIERYELAWMDEIDYDYWDIDEQRNWDEYRGVIWNIPDEFAGDWNN